MDRPPAAAARKARLVFIATVAVCATLAALAGPAARVAAAEELEIQASVDRSRVRVGDTLMLNVDVIGTQQARRPRLDDLKDFDVSYLGSTKKFSMINGKVSTQTGHRFMLTARKPGRYHLGPFAVPHEGQVYSGGDAVVEVVSAETGRRSGPTAAEPSEPELALELMPAKTEFWVGEKVPLRVQFSAGNVEVQGLDYPAISSDVITLDPFAEPARRTARVGGMPRRVLDFETSMIAVRPGVVRLGPATISVTVVEESSRNRGRTFGGFSLGLRRQKTVELESEPIEVTVRALPGEGRPEDFSGAVGSFDFEVEIGPDAISAGDPVTVRTLIAGAGNLSGVRPPAYEGTDGLRAYDPLPAPQADKPDTLVTEQIVIPRRDGAFELPALAFGYFDPQAGEYRTVVRGPFPISVGAVEPLPDPSVFARRDGGVQTRSPREPLGRDIVYIKERPGDAAGGRLLVLRATFAISVAFPLLMYFGASGYVRRRDRMASDPRIARFRRAGKEVRRRLADLEGRPAAQGLHDDLTAAVGEYLRAKLDLPPGAVDRESVLAALDDASADGDVRDAAVEFFERVEHVRYAGPATAGSDCRAALELARALVNALEGQRALAARIGVGAIVVALALGATGAQGAMALEAPAAEASAPDPVALFFEGNTAYRDGDYARAVERYEQSAAAGGRSGGLYFNLGNAYFKQAKVGIALLNYERARRVLPRDPDVDANRDFALETAGAVRMVTPVWVRIAFPLARIATADELAVVVLCAWWLLIGLLIARLVVISMRRGLGQAGLAAAVLLAFTLANLGYRLATIELVDAAVVVAPGGAVARYEPTPTGVEYFEATEGEVLRIRDRREGWLKLRRHDGLRGWIACEAVAEL